MQQDTAGVRRPACSRCSSAGRLLQQSCLPAHTHGVRRQRYPARQAARAHFSQAPQAGRSPRGRWWSSRRSWRAGAAWAASRTGCRAACTSARSPTRRSWRPRCWAARWCPPAAASARPRARAPGQGFARAAARRGRGACPAQPSASRHARHHPCHARRRRRPALGPAGDQADRPGR